MRKVTILMVNDDEDIIRDCIENRMRHFDLMAIEDSSHDNTPKICEKLCRKYPGRILYQWDDTPLTIKYHRTQLFKMLLDYGIDDDTWIFQLDTDIFFDADNADKGHLEVLLTVANEEDTNCIICRIAQFYPTSKDIKWHRHWKDFQYYSLNWQSKIIYKGLSKLFFKTDNQETPSVPDEKKCSVRPMVKHYQYRSPGQIQKKINRAYGVGSYSHITSKKWEDYIIDKDFLSRWKDPAWRRPHHSWRSLVTLTKEAKTKAL